MTDLISSNEILPIIERMEVAGTPHQLRLARLAFLRARHKEGVDPRLVLRYRRQRRMCLNCGIKTGRVVLCDGCRATLAYCPACESLYPRRASLPARCSSEHCVACVTRLSQGRRGGGSREDYNRRRQARRKELLPRIIQHRRAGMEYQQIADALGLDLTQIEVLIRDARKHGEWPAELRRKHNAHTQHE